MAQTNEEIRKLQELVQTMNTNIITLTKLIRRQTKVQISIYQAQSGLISIQDIGNILTEPDDTEA